MKLREDMLRQITFFRVIRHDRPDIVPLSVFDRLVHQYACADRSVERIYLAEHGERQHNVTVFSYEFSESEAFTSDNECQSTRQICLVYGSSVRLRTVYPDSVLFERFYGINKI